MLVVGVLDHRDAQAVAHVGVHRACGVGGHGIAPLQQLRLQDAAFVRRAVSHEEALEVRLAALRPEEGLDVRVLRNLANAGRDRVADARRQRRASRELETQRARVEGLQGQRLGREHRPDALVRAAEQKDHRVDRRKPPDVAVVRQDVRSWIALHGRERIVVQERHILVIDREAVAGGRKVGERHQIARHNASVVRRVKVQEHKVREAAAQEVHLQLNLRIVGRLFEQRNLLLLAVGTEKLAAPGTLVFHQPKLERASRLAPQLDQPVGAEAAVRTLLHHLRAHVADGNFSVLAAGPAHVGVLHKVLKEVAKVHGAPRDLAALDLVHHRAVRRAEGVKAHHGAYARGRNGAAGLVPYVGALLAASQLGALLGVALVQLRGLRVQRLVGGRKQRVRLAVHALPSKVGQEVDVQVQVDGGL